MLGSCLYWKGLGGTGWAGALLRGAGLGSAGREWLPPALELILLLPKERRSFQDIKLAVKRGKMITSSLAVLLRRERRGVVVQRNISPILSNGLGLTTGFLFWFIFFVF